MMPQGLICLAMVAIASYQVEAQGRDPRCTFAVADSGIKTSCKCPKGYQFNHEEDAQTYCQQDFQCRNNMCAKLYSCPCEAVQKAPAQRFRGGAVSAGRRGPKKFQPSRPLPTGPSSNYQDCGTRGEIHRFHIDGCGPRDTHCPVRSNSIIDGIMEFTPSFSSDKVDLRIVIDLLGMKIPVPLPSRGLCGSNRDCKLRRGEKMTYRSTKSVGPNIPQMPVYPTVRFEGVDASTGQTVICASMTFSLM